MKKLMYAMMLAFVLALPATGAMADPGPYDPQCTDPNGGVFTACQANNGVDIFNAINRVYEDRGLPSPGFTANWQTDSMQVVDSQEFWSQLSNGDQSEFAFISLTAGNMNQLGVFPAGGNAQTDSTFFNLSFTGEQFTGNGTAGNPYPGFALQPGYGDFGFSLRSTGPGGTTTFSSVPDQNSDGLDHMLAFHLSGLAGQHIVVHLDGNNDGDLDDPEDTIVDIELDENTFLLAWEDLPGNHDQFDSDYNDMLFLVTKVRPTRIVTPEPISMLLFGAGFAGLAATRRRKIR